MEEIDISTALIKFEASDDRLVTVRSGDQRFEGQVTKIEWDVYQWIYMVNGEWYCQSEIYPASKK